MSNFMLRKMQCVLIKAIENKNPHKTKKMKKKIVENFNLTKLYSSGKLINEFHEFLLDISLYIL